ncbi:MAG: monooxygenase [Nannocystaceae bacterium]|nr:monooxygenase [Nannocystaceae bacterium]
MSCSPSRVPILADALVALLLCNACASNDAPAAADESTSAAASDTTAAGTQGGSGSGSGSDGGEAAVTYYEHVKPIFDARCVACHNAGGIAPFSLEAYDDAAIWAPSVAAAVAAGTMPPWPPSSACNEYVGNRSLTDDQIALVSAWAADDAPMGDPANEGAPLDGIDGGLSRVDRSLSMAEPYTPQLSPDEYRCFLVPWPDDIDGTTYVTGFRAVPGNDAIVHHVIAFLATPDQVADYEALDAAQDGPGYTCFGGTGGPSRTWLGGWAPGGVGNDLPPGLGLEVPAGSMVILQLHYNTLSSDPAPDTTAIELSLADSVERVARVMPFANPAWPAGNMPIPADEADVVHEFQRDISPVLGGPQTVYAAALHMHTRGTRASLTIDRAGGDSDCVLEIDDWDFHWQGSYGLQTPLALGDGDELHLQCHFDNTAGNQPEVDGEPLPPADTNWGEGTTDEMCLGILLIAPS